MLRQTIFIRSLKNIGKCVNRRKSKVVIRQVETTKLSRAEQIKKLNYETSYLFGSKIKKKKKNEKSIAVKNDNDPEGVNSEIYWTVANKSKNADSEVIDSIDTNTENGSSKKISTRISANTEFREKMKLPETFAKFKLDLPKPVKVTIQDALNNLDSHINNVADTGSEKQNEIPFNQHHLKNMINFPLAITENDLVLETFQDINNNLQYIPSVSRILQATMPPSQKQALIQWKNLKIAELGMEGFEAMQAMYLSRGKKFHECLQKYFTNDSEIEIPPEIEELWKSITPVLSEFEQTALYTEERVKHPYLCYKGVVDCVSVHSKSQIASVIEWKNSDRHKKSVTSTFDAPLQLVAYLAGLNMTQFKDNPLKKGIIVVAYNDAEPANIFELSSTELEKYWKIWLNRLQEYWIRYRDNTLVADDL